MGFWIYVKDAITHEKKNIHTDDVDYMTTLNDNTTLLVVGNKKYIEVRGLEEYSDGLEKEGWSLTDGTYLVQLKKARYFDERKLELHFDYPPEKESIPASVARIHKNFIKALINN